MVTTCGATLVWSATTVTVAGAAGLLGGRRGCCIFSGAGDCTAGGVCTVAAAGAIVCAALALAREIKAVPAIDHINPR
jgi:hypothetical protein